MMIKARALYMFLLMPAMVDSVITSAELSMILEQDYAELMILNIGSRMNV